MTATQSHSVQSPSGQSPLTKLIAVEAKLFLREPAAVIWGLVFPALLLVLLGAFFPGFRIHLKMPTAVRLIDLYAPIVLGLCLATLAFATLPESWRPIANSASFAGWPPPRFIPPSSFWHNWWFS